MEEPTIEMYMTPCPYSIGQSEPLANAQQLMRTHQIRHLPVLEGQRLAGLLSQRDVHRVEKFRLVNPERVTIENAMTKPAYTVERSSTVREVAMHMAQNRYGSAVVVEDGRIVGIFTAVDGLIGLSLLLKQLLQASR
jgi:acetoin utilization protein AcuB